MRDKERAKQVTSQEVKQAVKTQQPAVLQQVAERVDIQFVLDTISKEVREDPRLVKQIFYILLSAYTNKPLNISSDGPTGVGKSYALNIVSRVFSRQFMMFSLISGQSDGSSTW